MRFLLKYAVSLTPVILLTAVVVSCGPSGEPRHITEVRAVETPRKPADPAATSAQRFGFEPMAQGEGMGTPHGVMPAPAPDAVAPEDPGLAWEAPAEWQEGEGKAFRLVSYRLGETQSTECYISVFPDAAGGAEENIARWYRQFGQDPPASIAGLPAVDLLGQACPMVEVSGDFVGMMGAAKPGYAMFGVICQRPGSSVFVKMVGPVEEVRVHKEAFLAFCASIKPGNEPGK
jgi:hypothetical protein